MSLIWFNLVNAEAITSVRIKGAMLKNKYSDFPKMKTLW